MIGYLIDYSIYYLLLLMVLQVVKEGEMITKTCKGKQTRNGISTSEGDVEVLSFILKVFLQCRHIHCIIYGKVITGVWTMLSVAHISQVLLL
jgi:hypothetical protein